MNNTNLVRMYVDGFNGQSFFSIMLILIQCHLLEDAETVVRKFRDDVGTVLLVEGFGPRQKIFQVLARNAFLDVEHSAAFFVRERRRGRKTQRGTGGEHEQQTVKGHGQASAQSRFDALRRTEGRAQTTTFFVHNAPETKASKMRDATNS